MTISLIIGGSGQDGALLASHLVSSGRKVFLTTRSDQASQLFAERTMLVGIYSRVHWLTGVTLDNSSASTLLDSISPDEIYYLAGPSSVSFSFSHPGETLNSTLTGLVATLEWLRNSNCKTHMFYAGSSEIFGNSTKDQISELTEAAPISPYGLAKQTALSIICWYRRSYGIRCSYGYLFNHESYLRGSAFVFRKLFDAALKIKNGIIREVSVGNLDVERDWGSAKDYVVAMALACEQKQSADYVIGTGRSCTLREITSAIFAIHELDYQECVFIDQDRFRPAEIEKTVSNPTKIFNDLGWKAVVTSPKRLIEEIYIDRQPFEKKIMGGEFL